MLEVEYMANDFSKMPAFHKFKIDLTGLAEANDTNTIIVIYAHMIIFNYSVSDIADKSGVSVSTLNRIFKERRIKHPEVRNLIQNTISPNYNLDNSLLQDLSEYLQYYFTCGYYQYREDQNEYCNKITTMINDFHSSAIEQLIFIIFLFQYGVERKDMRHILNLLKNIKEFYPPWVQKIIDSIFIMHSAKKKEKQAVYEYIAKIKERGILDIWDEYLFTKIPSFCFLMEDRVSFIYYLVDELERHDITKAYIMVNDYLRLARIFLLQGNFIEAKRLIQTSKLINIEDIDERIENMRRQYLAYIHFMEGNHLKIIELLKDIKEIGLTFYTSYYFLIYAYAREFQIEKMANLFNHLYKLPSQQNSILTTELLELLVKRADANMIKEKYKAIRNIIKVEYRLGLAVIIQLLEERSII